MTVNLNVNINLPNATRWMVNTVQVDDDAARMTVLIQLRTTGVTDLIVYEIPLTVINGVSSKLSRAVPTPLQSVTSVLSVGSLSTPTGFTDAMNAWKGGGNANARKTALEAYLLSSGIVDSSLAGV